MFSVKPAEHMPRPVTRALIRGERGAISYVPPSRINVSDTEQRVY